VLKNDTLAPRLTESNQRAAAGSAYTSTSTSLPSISTYESCGAAMLEALRGKAIADNP
jgi:hypothetical protein